MDLSANKSVTEKGPFFTTLSYLENALTETFRPLEIIL